MKLEDVLKIIDEEPELPGEPSAKSVTAAVIEEKLRGCGYDPGDYEYHELTTFMYELMRVAVRGTKRSIRARVTEDWT